MPKAHGWSRTKSGKELKRREDLDKKHGKKKVQATRRKFIRHAFDVDFAGSAEGAASMKKAATEHQKKTGPKKGTTGAHASAHTTMAKDQHYHDFKKVQKKRRKKRMGKTLRHTSRKR